MAKTRSIVQFKGTLGKITFVDSKAYGAHARSARGSIKPATLNAACLESSSNLIAVNTLAKLIFNPVNVLRGDHKSGNFWQRLLSKFRQQKKNNIPYHLKDLHRLEVWENYCLSNLADVTIHTKDKEATLNLAFKSRKHSGQPNGFCLTLLRIACMVELSATESVQSCTHFIHFNEPNMTITFTFENTSLDAQIIYCLKMETGFDSKPLGYIKGMGMCLLAG